MELPTISILSCNYNHEYQTFFSQLTEFINYDTTVHLIKYLLLKLLKLLKFY